MGKFKLGPFLRSTKESNQAMLSHKLRQYMALPLLKPHDMRAQLQRLEREVSTFAKKHFSEHVVKRFNGFHNYVVSYWMKFHGPDNVSVFNAKHKTNNINER